MHMLDHGGVYLCARKHEAQSFFLLLSAMPNMWHDKCAEHLHSERVEVCRYENSLSVFSSIIKNNMLLISTFSKLTIRPIRGRRLHIPITILHPPIQIHILQYRAKAFCPCSCAPTKLIPYVFL